MVKSTGLAIVRISVFAALLAGLGCDSDSGSNNAATGGGSDAISLSSVVWLDTDVSGWSMAATLNASVGGGMINLPYDKANVWPTTSTRASDGGPINGNCWVFVRVNGTWHAATFDWMRTGQAAKAATAVRGTGGHIPHAPLNTWTPRSGERYGFMVSTPARTDDRTINERSNVSMVTWP